MKTVTGPNPNNLKLIDILKNENNPLIKDIKLHCGGQGICGKCRVLVNGKIEHACEYIPSEGDVVDTIIAETPGIESSVRFDLGISTCKGYSCAVDLGTTTVVCALLKDSQVIDTISELNCQKIWGSDVISRMSFACSGEENRKEIRNAICNQISNMCNTLIKRNKVNRLCKTVVAANTAMTKILLGEDCTSLIKAPFTGQSEGFYGINNKVETIVLPCSFAYFGSDLSSGLYASGFYSAERPALFIDAGTNGEVALATSKGIFFSSSAAGPAFETAVESGLYGSEIINELTRCLNEDLIDKTGRIKGINVPFTQKEIRNIQLAKGAVAASITCLMKKAGILEKDLKTIFLAGGFGSALNIDNAIKIGLLPDSERNKFRILGNAALGGACFSACNPDMIYDIVKCVTEGCYLELFNDSSFNDEFADKMMFE